jgi:membrane fusion protein (multidrug efflux system)
MTPPDPKLHALTPPTPAQPAPAAAPANAPARRGRKRRVLAGVGAVAALAAAIVGVRAFLARGDETTDDAFVESDVVAIAPRVAGPVAEVLVAENA